MTVQAPQRDVHYRSMISRFENRQNGASRAQNVTIRAAENSLGPALILVLAILAGCGETVEPAAEPEESSTMETACLDNGGGFVNGELFGAIEMALAWPNSGTECQGMPRPGGNGARLRFARALPDVEANLVMILGIPKLSPAAAGNGLEATVTLIDERDGAFYSNAGVPNCWVDIYRQTELDGPDVTQVDGILYCSGALARQQGSGAVTPREIRFSGRIDWRGEPADDEQAAGAGESAKTTMNQSGEP